MAIIRWDPFEEIDKFFREDFLSFLPRRIVGLVPSVDVYEKDNDVVVESPLAGVDPKDVDISIEDDFLVIKGETKKKTEVDEKDYYRKEVHYGSFYRKVALPVPVVGEKAKAVSENGVLKITFPKVPGVEKEKAIKIAVEEK